MKRILVCDDSEFVRKFIKRELEGRYEIEIFNDGYEAYEYLKSGDTDFDFAIVDGEMPNMNGIELVEKMKKELGLENIPAVILTASDYDYFKKQAFEYGVFDYLKKPFKSGELLAYLKKFFEGTINRGRVLVVEDSKLQNHTISQQLKLKHIQPISAYSGEDALEILLKGETIDTMLLDIHLPGASGFQIAKALKNDSRFSWIPIIGITASEGEDRINTMNKAFQSGIDDFISKPYNMIEFFARVMANIKRGKLIKKLKEESEMDSLTKLYNRRTVFKFLEKAFANAKRYNQDLSFLMIDIDKFKNVNDTYGHIGGDEILRSIAKTIQSSVRESDIAGRFGGEEFSVVMPNTDIQGAGMVAEKIRKTIEENGVEFNNSTVNVTVSLGVSTIDRKNDTLENLVRKADEALYKAKDTGRNRVCVFDNDTNSISAS